MDLAASFREDGGDIVASLALSKAKIKKLVELAKEMASQDFASVAAPLKLAGKLRFAQTAILGMFGRAALEPIYELILKEAGAILRFVKAFLGRRAFVLPTIVARLV